MTEVPSKFTGSAQAALGAAAEHLGMSSPPPPDRAALGRARLAARARRIAQLRRRVAAATLATFALAFGVIAWRGETGTQAKTVQVARVSATATATPTATAAATTTATATPTATATATPTATATATATPDLTTSQS
jgi:hypothetical protein